MFLFFDFPIPIPSKIKWNFFLVLYATGCVKDEGWGKVERGVNWF